MSRRARAREGIRQAKADPALWAAPQFADNIRAGRCEDCPPRHYTAATTRCDPCPWRRPITGETDEV